MKLKQVFSLTEHLDEILSTQEMMLLKGGVSSDSKASCELGGYCKNGTECKKGKGCGNGGTTPDLSAW